jgi:ferritin
MIKEKIQSAINDQINREIFSAYLYYSMAAHFEAEGLKGFANWMKVQAMEEMFHADKFFGYIAERGGRVELKAIEGPKTSWSSPLEVFQAAYEHEQSVTAHIHKLVDLAIQESDHATNNFLQWYVAEQVEEEASAEEIISRLKLVARSDGGLFFLDNELAKRTYTPAATGA